MNTTVHTKAGDMEIGGNGAGTDDDLLADSPPARRANPVAGEISFVDHKGRTHLLRPTFEAALEIEDGLGTAIDGLRTKFAISGLQPAMTPTTREHGVIIAAGIRAAGEPRVDVDKATRLAWETGRQALRQPILDFLWAVCDGGRTRAEALKKTDSSTGSPDASEEQTAELIAQMARPSGAT